MAVCCQYEVLVSDVSYSRFIQDFVDILPTPLAVCQWTVRGDPGFGAKDSLKDGVREFQYLCWNYQA